MSQDLYLMVDPVGDQVFPVSARAFTVVTAPVARVLARNCVALFLAPNGQVWRIEHIHLPTQNPIKKLGLWLGIATSARFDLVTVQTNLDDMRTMILDAMTFSRKQGVEPDDWWLLTAPEQEIRDRLGAATDLAELYAAIEYPRDQDCLDLL